MLRMNKYTLLGILMIISILLQSVNIAIGPGYIFTFIINMIDLVVTVTVMIALFIISRRVSNHKLTRYSLLALGLCYWPLWLIISSTNFDLYDLFSMSMSLPSLVMSIVAVVFLIAFGKKEQTATD